MSGEMYFSILRDARPGSRNQALSFFHRVRTLYLWLTLWYTKLLKNFCWSFCVGSRLLVNAVDLMDVVRYILYTWDRFRISRFVLKIWRLLWWILWSSFIILCILPFPCYFWELWPTRHQGSMRDTTRAKFFGLKSSNVLYILSCNFNIMLLYSSIPGLSLSFSLSLSSPPLFFLFHS